MADKKLPDNAEPMRITRRIGADSEALVVLIIRVNGVAYYVDSGVKPLDAGDTITNEVSNLVQDLAEQRKKANHAASGN